MALIINNIIHINFVFKKKGNWNNGEHVSYAYPLHDKA